MSPDQLPALFRDISLFETLGLLLSAAVGFAVYPLLLRRHVHRPVRTAVLTTAVLLFLLTLSTVLAELFVPLPESGGGSELAAAISSFYRHPAGLLLGAAGLAALKGTAFLFPLAVAVYLYRRVHARQRFRKRCSSCHYIFPEHTQPHQRCPRCGAYWKYEK